MATKTDVSAILTAIAHQRQNVDDPDKVDVWLAGFLAGLARTNGMDPQTMAHEINRYFRHCHEREQAAPKTD